MQTTLSSSQNLVWLAKWLACRHDVLLKNSCREDVTVALKYCFYTIVGWPVVKIRNCQLEEGGNLQSQSNPDYIETGSLYFVYGTIFDNSNDAM